MLGLVMVIGSTPVLAQSWTTPKTWASSDILTAADMNTYVRDNTGVLRGGGISVTSQALGDLLCASSTSAFQRLDGSHAVGSLLISTGTGACPAFGTSIDGSITFSNASSILDFSGVTLPVIRFSGTNGTLQSYNDMNVSIDGDNNTSNEFNVINGANTTVFTVTESPIVFVNDSANAGMTIGLTINQGASDNEIIAFKSSDIAHGVTTQAETNTFGLIRKADAASGGVQIMSFTEGTYALAPLSIVTTADTTKTTTSVGVVVFDNYLKSGTSATSIGANGNLLVVRDQSTARFILDADGDSHQDVGTAWTNFDSHDDAKVLNALAVEVARPDDPYKNQIKARFASAMDSLAGRDELQRIGLVTFNEDGHHFVNMSKLAMLHTGAIRQQADKVQMMEARFQQLEQENIRLAARLAAIEGTDIRVSR